jgi:hypothetical protein
MNDLLAQRLEELNRLMATLDADSEVVRRDNPKLAWKLDVMSWKVSNAVSEIHEVWEEDAESESEM